MKTSETDMRGSVNRYRLFTVYETNIYLIKLSNRRIAIFYPTAVSQFWSLKNEALKNEVFNARADTRLTKYIASDTPVIKALMILFDFINWLYSSQKVAPNFAQASILIVRWVDPPMSATNTGAEQLLKAAVEQGIDVCFANPGERHV